MRIVLTFTEDVSEIKPRDVRNFCGSITEQKFNNIIMYHGNDAPPIIYKKPFKYAIEILFYENNFFAFQHLMEKLEQYKNNFFGRKIKKIIPKEDGYMPPFYLGSQTIEYSTRTPIIITANKIEHNMKYYFEKNEKIQDYISYRIKRNLSYQLECYTKFKQNFENLILNFKDFRIITEKYKENINYIGLWANFTSNYQLPEMIGYKNGLGYGQLLQNTKIDIKK